MATDLHTSIAALAAAGIHLSQCLNDLYHDETSNRPRAPELAAMAAALDRLADTLEHMTRLLADGRTDALPRLVIDAGHVVGRVEALHREIGTTTGKGRRQRMRARLLERSHDVRMMLVRVETNRRAAEGVLGMMKPALARPGDGWRLGHEMRNMPVKLGQKFHRMLLRSKGRLHDDHAWDLEAEYNWAQEYKYGPDWDKDDRQETGYI